MGGFPVGRECPGGSGAANGAGGGRRWKPAQKNPGSSESQGGRRTLAASGGDWFQIRYGPQVKLEA